MPTVFSVMMLVTALAFFFLTLFRPGAPKVESHVTIGQQLTALKDPNVWKICQYYSIVFGGYVALALWMTKYYVQEYSFDLKTAAFLAACFASRWRAAGTGRLVLRQVRRPQGDLVGAVGLLDLSFILSHPQTEFTIKTVSGP